MTPRLNRIMQRHSRVYNLRDIAIQDKQWHKLAQANGLLLQLRSELNRLQKLPLKLTLCEE